MIGPALELARYEIPGVLLVRLLWILRWSVLLRRRVRILWLIFINRELPLWPFQLDGDIHLGLVNVEIFPVSLKSLRQHLHSQHAIGDAVEIRLSIRVGLQLQAAALLLALQIDWMHDHGSISHRLSVVILDHQEVQQGRRFVVTIFILLGDSQARCRKHPDQHHADCKKLSHAAILCRRTPSVTPTSTLPQHGVVPQEMGEIPRWSSLVL